MKNAIECPTFQNFSVKYFCLFIEVPDKPEAVEVVDVQKNSVKLQWTPPIHDGGSPITGYVIEKRDMKRPTWTQAGKAPKDATDFTVDKLPEGSEYLFRVVAENKKGLSKPCETKAPVITKSPYGKIIDIKIVCDSVY